MRFTIRDWFWLTVVVAIGLAWWVDNQRIEKAVTRIEKDRRELHADFEDRMTVLDDVQKNGTSPGCVELMKKSW